MAASPERIAEIFVRALSSASLVPIALAAPTAIVREAADLGIVHAGGSERDYQFEVEIYNLNRGSTFSRVTDSSINRPDISGKREAGELLGLVGGIGIVSALLVSIGLVARESYLLYRSLRRSNKDDLG